MVYLLILFAIALVASLADNTGTFPGLAYSDLKPYETRPSKPGEPAKPTHTLQMIAKWSGIGMVKGSGKIQGTVMQVNDVVRVWAKPRNVRDSFTYLVRGLLSGISTSYRALTPAQIAAWNAAAFNYLRKNALAEVKKLTGSQAYQRVNNILASIGEALRTDPPGVGIIDAIVQIGSVNADESAQTFTIGIAYFSGVGAVPADSFVKVFATRQVGPSKASFSKSDYRFIGYFPATTVTNPLDIATDYIARFGALVEGQRIGVAAQPIFYDGTNFVEGGRIFADGIVVA